MLRFLGKRNRSRNALLVFFVAVLAIGLVIAFVPSFSGIFSGKASSDAAVASVAGYKITVREFRDALSLFGQQMARGQGSSRIDDPATVYAIYGPQVLDNLIRQKLIQYEAEQLNLITTDREVQERLKQIFSPWPGPDQYRSRLRQAGYSVDQFEDNLRASISEEKLKGYVAAAAQVSPQEAEEDYRRNKTTYNVRWVDVEPEKLRDKVQVNEPDLRAYFEQHKQEFHIATEQRHARYLFIDQEKAGQTIQVADEELRANFDPERGVQQVRVSQIVLNIPKEKPAANANGNASGGSPAANNTANKNASGAKPALTEADVKSKADETVSRARGDQGKPPEDFARLARELSQDQKSRMARGDIGWVNKKDKRETDDPLNRVFTMKKDDVSPPVKKGDKFYILKVTDRKLPTFEESREQLLKEARATKGYSKAVEIATEAEQKFKDSKNAEAVAGEINQKYGVQAVSAKETPFFGQTEPLTGLGPEFDSAVFQLLNPGDIGDRQNVTNGFAIPQYLDKQDPHDPTFEEARKKVEDSYRNSKAKDIAAERARELARAKTPDALKAAAEAMGLKVEERTGLTGSDSIGPLTSELDRGRVQKLNPGELTREPVKPASHDDYVVAALTSRKDADMGEEFQKERKSIEDRLLEGKRDTLFSTFLATTQKRLKDEGKIKTYQNVIDEAITSNEPPPQPGGGTTPGRTRPRRRAPGTR